MLVKLRANIPEIFLGVFLTIAVFGMGMLFSSSPSPPQHQQTKNSTESTKHESSKSGAEERLADYTWWLAWLTGALAFSTIGLWVVTILTLRHSRKTAERELRAYVIVGESDIRLIEKHLIQTFIHLHNYGPTPAYDVRSWVDMRIGKPDQPPFAQKRPFLQSTMIGPGADFIIGPDSISVSAEVPDQIRTGTRVIFIWGEAKYRDTFGKRWIFRFFARNSEIMMRIEDVVGITSPGWGLSPYPGLGYQEHEAEDED